MPKPSKERWNSPTPRQIAAKKGGEAGKGKSKARTSEQARAAVAVRWANYYAKKARESGEAKE